MFGNINVLPTLCRYRISVVQFAYIHIIEIIITLTELKETFYRNLNLKKEYHVN